ncbi:MAG: YfjI family protein, partial [Cetobacterium sp.]
MCPKKLDFGWSEVPNLWCMIVSPPGSMKSHCISEPLKIIKRLATQAREDLKKAKDAFRKEITIYQSNHSSLKKELEKARRKLLLNDNPEEQKSIEDTITNYEKKLDNLVEPRVPFEKRYLTSDATTETLQEILKNNENGLLVERDELISLLLSFEMKGRETDRGFYLSAWNGHSSYNVDRIGRGSIYIPCLCLSIVGGTQPEKIQAYIAKNTSALTNDGLIQRFQLMVYPDFFERKYVDVFPDNQAKNSVYDVAKTISSEEFLRDCFGTKHAFDERKLLYFSFDYSAQEIFEKWITALEKRIYNEDECLLKEHWSKYRGLIPSLSLIFHVITLAHTKQDRNIPVTQDMLNMAILWQPYLESHAKRVFDMGRKLQGTATESLSKNILQKRIEDKFTIRDIYRKNIKHIGRSTELAESACEELEKLGWLKAIET